MKSPLGKVERTGEKRQGIKPQKQKASKLLRAFGRITGSELSLSYQAEKSPGASTFHAYHDPHAELGTAPLEAERYKAMGRLAYQRSNLLR